LVRVALTGDIENAALYSVGTVEFHDGSRGEAAACRGRFLFSTGLSTTTISVRTGCFEDRAISLPCTLQSRNAYNYIELNEKSYRGSVILVSRKAGTFMVVNYLDVEEYLRGVVPWEMGRQKEEALEALKAQAVAARTYTLRKMLSRRGHPFDLLPTVNDQVYGGVDGEYRLSDIAIRLTRNLVMTCNDTLIHAYYHSTCGGRTANVDDVWDKPPAPYLRSVSDLDSSGTPFCISSPYYTWKQRWTTRDLSSIIRRFRSTFSGCSRCGGAVQSIQIESRFDCGRVHRCRIATENGKCSAGGDKIRFLFRRNERGYPILRSAHITDIKVGSRTVTMEGRGYGHGVGMCQVGALERAKRGQSFEKILKKYYSGIEIRTILPKN
jgi:stage II sporulation protein D